MAEIQRHGHEMIAHFVCHVRGDLAQVGEPVLPSQFAVFRFQFVGQATDFSP